MKQFMLWQASSPHCFYQFQLPRTLRPPTRLLIGTRSGKRCLITSRLTAVATWSPWDLISVPFMVQGPKGFSVFTKADEALDWDTKLHDAIVKDTQKVNGSTSE